MTVVSFQSLLGRPIKVLTSIVDPIGPTLHGDRVDTTAPPNIGWISLLFVVGAVSLFMLVISHMLGRQNYENLGLTLFWCGSLTLTVPFVGRLTRPVLSRGERIALLVILGEFMFLLKMVSSPTAFTNFDEMLHLMTAYDVLHRQQLFLGNALLPISPFYPALEILTTAIANVLNIEIFPAAFMTLAVLRGIFIVAMFLFFERITQSARIAALACLIYMGASTFVVFDAAFAYESLAVVLCVGVMLAETRVVATNLRTLVIPALFIATLTVTHHMSAIWGMFYITCIFILRALQSGQDADAHRVSPSIVVVVVVFTVLTPLMWMSVEGNPLVSYMGPVLENGIDSVLEKLHGSSASREMFVNEDGSKQPIINLVLGILYTVVIAIGLATGFFRSLALRVSRSVVGWSRLLMVARREWVDSRVVLLTIGAFGFPISVAFRLSPSGWEIGNRMNTFVFFSVGLVLAIGLVHFWQARNRWYTTLIATFILSTILLGGIIVGTGPYSVRSPYRVSADSGSIEPMGIDAALWTKEWLGIGNRFSTDRVNRTLLATYGDQQIISSMGGVDGTRVFLNDKITPSTLFPIRRGHIEFLLVDLRLTTGLALLGEYYERYERLHGPPRAKDLLKFDDAPEASRIFDNGYIVIYDVRRYLK